MNVSYSLALSNEWNSRCSHLNNKTISYGYFFIGLHFFLDIKMIMKLYVSYLVCRTMGLLECKFGLASYIIQMLFLIVYIFIMVIFSFVILQKISFDYWSSSQCENSVAWRRYPNLELSFFLDRNIIKKLFIVLVFKKELTFYEVTELWVKKEPARLAKITNSRVKLWSSTVITSMSPEPIRLTFYPHFSLGIFRK